MTAAAELAPTRGIDHCVLCRLELEGFPEPLCTTCRSTNYVVRVGDAWIPFTNEGRLILRSVAHQAFENVAFIGHRRKLTPRRY
jgi:hypothetical protein